MTTDTASLAQPDEQLPAGVAQQPNADSKDPERGEPPQLEDEKPTSRKRPGIITRLRTHLNEDVSTSHADILMLTCCLVSGLVDSTIYNAYGTFVSMQTGTSRHPPISFPPPIHALISIYTSLTRNFATQETPYSSASAVPRRFTALQILNPTAGPNPSPRLSASSSAAGSSRNSPAISVPSGVPLSPPPSCSSRS